MVYGNAYRPSLAELACVEYCQRNGAPQKVEFLEIQGAVVSGYVDHIIRFTAPNGKIYEAESRLIVPAPYYSLVEMDRDGMLTPPATPRVS